MLDFLTKKARLKVVPGLDKRKVIFKRRAIFVCAHPDKGLVVLDRSLFQRSLFSPRDECGNRGSLFDTAQSALRNLYGSDLKKFSRLGVFEQQGMLSYCVRNTVFLFETVPQEILRQVPDIKYIPLETHPLYERIKQHCTLDAARKKSGIG